MMNAFRQQFIVRSVYVSVVYAGSIANRPLEWYFRRSDDRAGKSVEVMKKLIVQRNLKLDEYESAYEAPWLYILLMFKTISRSDSKGGRSSRRNQGALSG